MRHRSGHLRHRVTVRLNTPTVDGYGVRADSWSDIEEVWADVRPLSGDEYLRASRTGAQVTHRMVMRYRTDLGTSDVTVLPRYQLTYDSRTFEVLHVIDVEERHRWLELLVREVL